MCTCSSRFGRATAAGASALFLCSLLVASVPATFAAETRAAPAPAARKSSANEKQGIVIQVSDDNPGTWNQALNVAENMADGLGKDNVKIEIVAFGKGIGMLKFDSPVAGRLSDALKENVTLGACAVTMRKAKLTEKDMFTGATVLAKGGVVEMLARQKQGWFIVRP